GAAALAHRLLAGPLAPRAARAENVPAVTPVPEAPAHPGRDGPAARRPRTGHGMRLVLAVVATVLAVGAARWVTPERFPAYDGTLRPARAAGGDTLTADARWAVTRPVPATLRRCVWVVLVLAPPELAGWRDARALGRLVRPESTGAARRVVEQYRDVLPLEIEGYGRTYVLDQPARRFEVSMRVGAEDWVTPTPTGGSAHNRVRAWLSAACPAAVHGIVELDMAEP
ncbi:MAG: hypothetical protein M3Q27_17780, partial [Actinomycetota bacterium]|nr:hypothetical protein [Actinomycetota bacterium]